MKAATSGANSVGSRSQPVQRPVFDAPGVANRRAADKGCARSQRRKQVGDRYQTPIASADRLFV